MREIKFRVWDKKESEWLAASDPNSLTYYGFHLFGEVMMMQRVHPEDLPDLVIEQYTGRKDKNGVEIYEGDVLRGMYHTSNTNEKKMQVGVVKFEDVNAGFFVRCINPIRSDGYTSPNLNHISGMNEVIGNIHENPELLKEQS